MPNRILKESICSSATIDGLSEAEEVFFYRLLVQCDDYGRMDARPCILRARCYPLRLDTITDEIIGKRVQALVRAGLVWLYEVDGHEYLQVATWEKHQQRRARHSKYPDPPADAAACNHLQSDDIMGDQPPTDDSTCPRGIEESRNRGIEESRNRGIENREPTGVGTAPAALPAGLSEAGAEFFRQFRRKRWGTPEQREQFEQCERDVGGKIMMQAVKWAAVKGFGDVARICSAARKMAKGQARASPPCDGREVIVVEGTGGQI